MASLTDKSASELARMIREGETTSMAIVEAHIARIEQYNPLLNAVCTLDTQGALTQARAVDEAIAQGESLGPLHGVPITIKDIFETKDIKTTSGYVPLKDYMPKQDATAVARLRKAGAIVVGKTNLAELAGDFQSTSTLFPRVNNPWNLDYTPGGSSGGSAAAVAAGLSPFDIGNDIAGSVRQPAHFCGVYGLKVTDGRISTAGMIPEVPGMPHCLRHMMTVGCFARSLADIRLGLSLIAGADTRRPTVPPVPLDTPANKPISRLRVAWCDQWPEVPVSSEIRGLMQQVFEKLSAANLQPQRWMPETFDLSEILNTYTWLAFYTNVYAQPQDRYNIKRGLTQIFRTATQGDKSMRPLGDFSRLLSQAFNPKLKDYFEILTKRDAFTAYLDNALAPWDVWLLPVAATAAFTHRPSWSAVEIDGLSYPHAIANGAYTMPFSLSGHPAVVIPIGRTAAGLPVGLQIVGKRWKEMNLIAIAQQLNEIVGDFQMPDLTSY